MEGADVSFGAAQAVRIVRVIRASQRVREGIELSSLRL
jgi:hypothetical protein